MIVRPGLVWGPGDTSLLPDLAAGVRSGRFAWLGGGRQSTVVTHIDNLVEGLVRAAIHGRAGEAYYITDEDEVSLRSFVSALLATQGLVAPDRSYPAPAGRFAAAGCEEAWARLRVSRPPPLTRLQAWIATTECRLESTRARNVLGYRPVRSRDEAMAELSLLARDTTRA